jgi:glycosyltransferase involved in cell wall biosynthesis
VEFVGYLSEDRVREQLYRANVFVSPSAMENQSTALGEAMLLGVPSVASRVGAMEEMIDSGEDGFLYDFENTEALAERICRIFENRDLALEFSRKGQLHAARTYDREKNCRDLLDIYEHIGGDTQ